MTSGGDVTGIRRLLVVQARVDRRIQVRNFYEAIAHCLMAPVAADNNVLVGLIERLVTPAIYVLVKTRGIEREPAPVTSAA